MNKFESRKKKKSYMRGWFEGQGVKQGYYHYVKHIQYTLGWNGEDKVQGVDSLLPELFKTQLNSSRVDTYTVTFELSGSMFKSYKST